MGSTLFPVVAPPQGGTPSLPGPGQPGPMKPGDFAGGAVPNLVSFLFNQVSPPSNLYLQRDDAIVLEASTQLSSDTVFINGRILLPSARTPGQPSDAGGSAVPGVPLIGPGYVLPFSQTLQVTSALAGTAIALQATEGYLLSLTVRAGSAVVRGQTFVRVWLNRGAVGSTGVGNFALLVSGYSSALTVLGWPGGTLASPADGGGFLAGYAPSNPAAGSDFSVTTSSVGRIRLQSFIAQLVTSATAGNRFPIFSIRTNAVGGTAFEVGDPTAVPASTTIIYSLSSGGQAGRSGGSPAAVVLPVPSPFLGRNQITVLSTTQGIQAGDQWSAIQMQTEEWLDLL